MQFMQFKFGNIKYTQRESHPRLPISLICPVEQKLCNICTSFAINYDVRTDNRAYAQYWLCFGLSPSHADNAI